jgi:hypothetical protein
VHFFFKLVLFGCVNLLTRTYILELVGSEVMSFTAFANSDSIHSFEKIYISSKSQNSLEVE